MRSPIWSLGVDLADKPRRPDEHAMAEVMAVVDQWVTTPAGTSMSPATSPEAIHTEPRRHSPVQARSTRVTNVPGQHT